jgi:phosphoribosylanthranilate isomerase
MIQIAGVRDLNDLKLILETGVELIGFPMRLGYHTPDTSEEVAAALIRNIPYNVKAVLITYLAEAEEIIELARKLNTKVIQLHGAIEVSEIQKLKILEPGISVIKSLIVRENNLEELSAEVRKFSSWVDFFITDTFDPSTGATGATGKAHDWNTSRRLVEISPRPVILAGGLNSMNVTEAIQFVKPAGVDVHTGVENSKGQKDPVLVQEFVKKARAALKSLH